MTTIVLNNILLSNANLPQAGNLFYFEVKKSFDISQPVVVDMNGVTSLPSIFLNVSIGKIIDEFGIDMLKKRMSFVKITQGLATRLKGYLETYKLD